jgi:hypothetical protein
VRSFAHQNARLHAEPSLFAKTNSKAGCPCQAAPSLIAHRRLSGTLRHTQPSRAFFIPRHMARIFPLTNGMKDDMFPGNGLGTF